MDQTGARVDAGGGAELGLHTALDRDAAGRLDLEAVRDRNRAEGRRDGRTLDGRRFERRQLELLLAERARDSGLSCRGRIGPADFLLATEARRELALQDETRVDVALEGRLDSLDPVLRIDRAEAPTGRFDLPLEGHARGELEVRVARLELARETVGPRAPRADLLAQTDVLEDRAAAIEREGQADSTSAGSLGMEAGPIAEPEIRSRRSTARGGGAGDEHEGQLGGVRAHVPVTPRDDVRQRGGRGGDDDAAGGLRDGGDAAHVAERIGGAGFRAAITDDDFAHAMRLQRGSLALGKRQRRAGDDDRVALGGGSPKRGGVEIHGRELRGRLAVRVPGAVPRAVARVVAIRTLRDGLVR